MGESRGASNWKQRNLLVLFPATEDSAFAICTFHVSLHNYFFNNSFQGDIPFSSFRKPPLVRTINMVEAFIIVNVEDETFKGKNGGIKLSS